MTDVFRDQLEARVRGYLDERSRLEAELADLHASLLDVERRIEAAVDLYEREYRAAPSIEGIRRRTPIRGADRSNSWADAIAAALAAEGGPLHVSDIWDALMTSGFETDSADPLRAIVATIVRNPRRFSRVGPNVFRLTDSE